jgi:hypothetical protein
MNIVQLAVNCPRFDDITVLLYRVQLAVDVNSLQTTSTNYHGQEHGRGAGFIGNYHKNFVKLRAETVYEAQKNQEAYSRMNCIRYFGSVEK